MFATTIVLAGLMTAQIPVDESLDLTITPGAQLIGTGLYGRAASDCDDFNRADGPMSGNWSQIVGGQNILNSMGYGNAGTGNQWMESTSANCPWDQSTTSIDFADNTAGVLKYVAAVTGTGGSNNFFTKIQSQGSTLYNFIGFYQGFNGGGWGTGGGFASITPVVDGRIDISYSAGTDELVMDIDEGNNGSIDYTYTAASASTVGSLAGSGHGIGTFGPQNYDNWDLNGGCGGGCNVSLSVAGGCGLSTTFSVSGGTGTYAVLSGAPGSFTFSGGICAGTTIGVSPPTFRGLMGASLTVNIPAGACGVGVDVVDAGTCCPANSIVTL